MRPSLFLLFILLEFQTQPGVADAGAPLAETKDFLSLERKFPNWLERAKVLKRSARGTKNRSFGENGEQSAPGGDHRRSQTTLRSGGDAPAQPPNGSSERWSGLFNPLYPLTDGSYWAYGVTLLALLLFAAGVAGNLALMCTVWHNTCLKSTWNCVLAGLALCDFLVLFFCLPVVVFHELSVTRLLGDLSCRLVPYLEVTSLGIATFSLCALSIDRFNGAVAPASLQKPKVEACQSIVSKLSIIWVGSMLLAAPELLLWKLLQETVSLPTPPTYMQQNQLGGTLIATLRTRPEKIKVDICVREPSAELSDSVYSLVLTYQQARMWWFFGCYVCLPLLFSLACELLTRQVSAQQLPQTLRSRRPPEHGGRPPAPSPASRPKTQRQPRREHRPRSAVMALAVLHMACNAPESICSIVLSSVSAYLRAELLTLALGLVGQFLLFLRCAATPLLMLSLCRPLGQAFVDCCCCCCCCCCEDCVPDRDSSPSVSTSTTVTSTSASPTSLAPSSKDGVERVLPKAATPRRGQLKAPSLAFGTPC